MSAYPTVEDYVAAAEEPDRTFRNLSLRQAVFALHPRWHIPAPASGNAAVVFKASVDHTDQALRFFIKEDASNGERYAALARHFAMHQLLDCVASMRWIDDAVEINGRTWPMVQMEWIEGRTLEVHVGDLAKRSDVGALHQLAGQWRDRVGRLQDAEFGHGDLQHGNVLVEAESSALRLVDFDGAWIPDFAEWPPPVETGQPNYQRTGRIWGRWMDTFPGLVIYTGLLGLSRRPDAWRALHTGENLLLSADDFVRPGETEAWKLLDSIEDPEVAHVVARLRSCCVAGWSADGPLEELLGREHVSRPLRTETRTPPLFQLPPGGPRDDWWITAEPIPMAEAGNRQVSTPDPDDDRPLFPGVSTSTGSASEAPKDGHRPTTGSATSRPGSDRKPAATALVALAAIVLVVCLILAAGGESGAAVTVLLIGGLVTVLVARSHTRR
ncbi:hypothetical protein [Pseudonocardia sp.]|uniref:hypothetical protein n=1 Tax=Pseudonocardia sp. TaxID=60912 RepID=UPI003D110CE9